MAEASAQARYVVGIDLGTTHTVVCFADSAATDAIQLFPIPQLTAAGEVAACSELPSFRYHPSPAELSADDCVLPWSAEPSAQPKDYLVGALARDLGSKVEGRVIASAKSWLCHDQVDRQEPILPWSGYDDVARVSPVTVSASYLEHVRSAWDHAHPDAPLADQQVVVTVPASFDEAARILTVEAAERAGLSQITLLEEPQAVCYDWYWHHQRDREQRLADVNLLFVVDIGGGTTDLSLIHCEHTEQGLGLKRIAVGEHLMLGGDNLDLALARLVEPRLQQGAERLNAAGLSQLVQQCRLAKERLLEPAAPEAVSVTLAGRGSRLIASARSADLTRAEVLQVALEGFFPLTPFGSRPQRKQRAVVEFGLPYAADAAISRHLSAFLADHQNACRRALGVAGDEPVVPDAVLVNGGVFHSSLIHERLREQLTAWRGAAPLELENQRPAHAVAFGAVAFALSQRAGTLQIGGGAARSCFIQVEQAGADAVAVCVLPQGSEPNNQIQLESHAFNLQLNQPVQFQLLEYRGDTLFAPGDVVNSISDDQFVRLPPYVAALDDGSGRSRVKVALTATLTEVGTLDLRCLELEGDGNWELAFSIRRPVSSAKPSVNAASTQAQSAQVQAAIDLIDAVYGSSNKDVDAQAVKRLRQSLERKLGPRADWDIETARALFDALWERRKRRRRSQAHERLWFNLAGFCLRPGCGHPADEWRLRQVWEIHQQGLQFDKEAQSWSEWWTFWRRASGGLDVTAQQALYKQIGRYLNPASARNLKLKAEVKQRAYEDMVKLSAALERLPAATKIELGKWLVARLQKSSETVSSWWALGRVGSRIPVAAGLQTVLPADSVAPWLKFAEQQDWRKRPEASLAAVMMAQYTGDRERDFPESARAHVRELLESTRAPELWQRMLMEIVVLEAKDSRRMLGEAMPIGLQLIQQ